MAKIKYYSPKPKPPSLTRGGLKVLKWTGKNIKQIENFCFLTETDWLIHNNKKSPPSLFIKTMHDRKSYVHIGRNVVRGILDKYFIIDDDVLESSYYEPDNPKSYKYNAIICSALKHKETGEVIKGFRHYHCINEIKRLYGDEDKRMYINNYEQGFIDMYGNFVDRVKATNIVLDNGQYVDKTITGRLDRGDELFSENLYMESKRAAKGNKHDNK